MNSSFVTKNTSHSRVNVDRDQKEALATYICREIANQDVGHIFMIPGGYVDNFSQGIVDTDNLEAVVSASEAGAAMMADGYARSSQKFGVCLSISGPGATNMLTSLSLSSADQIPILAITGEPPLSWRDRDAIQDPGTQGLKSLDLLKIVSKAQYQVFDASAIRNYMQRVMGALCATDKGTVNLSVPMDQQAQRISTHPRELLPVKKPNKTSDQQALEEALHVINKSPRTVLLIGAGVRKSGAFDSVVEFANLHNIPVATTISAKGDFPENHALALGVFGWAGTNLANEVLLNSEIDCLVVVGSKLGQIASMCWSQELVKERALIHIDIRADHIDQTYSSDVSAVSDADEAFKYFLNSTKFELANSHVEERLLWVKELKECVSWHQPQKLNHSDLLPIHPGVAIQELSSVSPVNTQVFVDNGAHTFFTTHYWEANNPNHFFNAIKYSGAMGWSIPASIGAKVAQPFKPTLAIAGDGCMLMHGIEIQTAARLKLSQMVFVVMNNCAHGNPKLRAKGLSEAAQEITDITDHDWAAFAESLGVKGLTIRKTSELQNTFKTALTQEGPVLIDIKCGLYETPTRWFDETFMKEFNKNLSA